MSNPLPPGADLRVRIALAGPATWLWPNIDDGYNFAVTGIFTRPWSVSDADDKQFAQGSPVSKTLLTRKRADDAAASSSAPGAQPLDAALASRLTNLGLHGYASQFSLHGYDRLSELVSMTRAELHEVARDVQMSKNHARRFVKDFSSHKNVVTLN